MNYIRVKNIQHLDELLEQGKNEFVVVLGVLRMSKYITKEQDTYCVYNYVDSTEEQMTAEQFMEDRVGAAMMNGMLYCEVA